MTVSCRLYLVDTRTGEKFLLAAKIIRDGWTAVNFTTKPLDDWIKGRDLAASTGSEPTGFVLKTEGVNARATVMEEGGSDR